MGLQYSIAHHPQTDGPSEVVNRCLETYLKCAIAESSNCWTAWLPLAEFWYNTNYHFAIHISPFEALYGIPPPIHIPYFLGDSSVAAVDIQLRDKESQIQLLKHHLARVGNRMKQLADKHKSDSF